MAKAKHTYAKPSLSKEEGELEHNPELKENLNQEMEEIIQDLINKKFSKIDGENSLDINQQAQEEKSDNETLIPDEEINETPILFEIELATNNGIKRIEFRQSDHPNEVASKIAEENRFNKALENAIKYKLTKAMSQTNKEN